MRRLALLAASLISIMLASCHGGGSNDVVPVGAASKTLGSASFSITVPPAPRGGSRSMQSVQVSLVAVNGAAPKSAVAPVTMDLATGTKGCSLAAGGAMLCTVKIAVPAGSDTFSVRTYAQPGEAGQQVSTSQLTTSISAGRSTTCVKKNAVSPR